MAPGNNPSVNRYVLLQIESNVLCLCRDKFGTIGKKDSVKLSQVWNLNHRYRVGALRKHKYSILHEGRNNSVVALARGNYDEKELVRLPLGYESFRVIASCLWTWL